MNVWGMNKFETSGGPSWLQVEKGQISRQKPVPDSREGLTITNVYAENRETLGAKLAVQSL